MAGVAAPAAAEAGAGAVLAIMPGKIIRVMVEVGQQVEEGEPVCVLEAIKMENELHARQGGSACGACEAGGRRGEGSGVGGD